MKPSLSELKDMNLDGYNIIPIYDEIYSDVKTPIQVLKNFKAVSKKCFLLESVSQEKWGRYSFLGYDPKIEIKCKDNLVTIIRNGREETFKSDAPMNEIRKIIKNYKSPMFKDLPNFTGGFVGYASYDTLKYSEPVLKFTSYDEANFNDYHFMLYDKVIAFDNLKQRIFIIVNIKLII